MVQEGEGMIIDGNRKGKIGLVQLEQKGERHGSEIKQEGEKSCAKWNRKGKA